MQTKYPVEGGDSNPDGTRSSSGTSPTSTVHVFMRSCQHLLMLVAPASMKPKKNLRTLLHVLSLLRRKAITPQRLRLLSEDLDAPARPWR
jgi:hypothetical protein